MFTAAANPLSTDHYSPPHQNTEEDSFLALRTGRKTDSCTLLAAGRTFDRLEQRRLAAAEPQLQP